MEVSYGIGVTNRYALFYDENEDPLDIIQQTDKKEAPKKSDVKEVKASKTPDVKDKKAPQPPANGQVKKGPNAAATTASKSQDQNKPKEEGKAPGGKPQQNRDRSVRFPNDNREDRNNRRNFDERGPREFTAPRAEGEGGFSGADNGFRGRGTGPRNPGRGMGRGRARGRGGVQDNRGKREYERQSGSVITGIKSVDKREGAGPHNWGSVKDDIEGQLDASAVQEFTDWTKDVAEGETAAAAATTEEPKAEGEAEEVVPVEEGPQELTLDEWKARQGERKKPEFNIRKPGEGEDNAQWKKTFALEKKKELEEEEEEEEEDYTGEFPQRAGRQKRLDIDIRFADTRRGGPGGVRGGRGRGGPRGGGRGFGGERGERGFGGERGERGFGGERGERGFGGERGERPEGGRGFGGERAERPEGGRNGGGERGERPEGGEQPARRGAFRGVPRSGRGYSGPVARGPAQQHAPKVDDENDFPALG